MDDPEKGKLPSILLEKPKITSIGPLTNSFYKSFQAIEPWHRAEKIELGLPQATVDRIVTESDKCLIAIQEIVQTVGDGATFSKDVMMLCPDGGQSIKSSEPLKSAANMAYQSTSKTREQLRNIHKALSDIIGRVESHRANELFKDPKSAQNAVIRLPKPLTHNELGEGKKIIEEGAFPRISETKTAIEVTHQLGIAEKNIRGLANQVDEFMTWWDWARRSLNVNSDGTNKHRIPDIRNGWGTILAQYEKNTDRISAIRSWSSVPASSALPPTSNHDPPPYQSSTAPSVGLFVTEQVIAPLLDQRCASPRPNKLEESEDEAPAISVADLITLQSATQPVPIPLLSTAVSIVLDTFSDPNGIQRAGGNMTYLKRVVTYAVYTVLQFYAERRSNGRKMPKDLDGNLQDLVNSLADIKTFVQKIGTNMVASSGADVAAIKEFCERMIQTSNMLSLQSNNEAGTITATPSSSASVRNAGCHTNRTR